MKLNKIYTLLLASLFIATTACGDKDEIIYNGETNDQALIGFSKDSYNLEISKDATGVLNIPVTTSALRNVDRTYNVTIITGDENTTADPSTYNLPGTVVIPANEYQGILQIEGFDNNVETTPELLTITLTNIEEESATYTTTATINIYEVCPVPEDFLVGDYAIADDTATIGPGNNSENFEASTVSISIGETGTQRVFDVNVLPGIGGKETIILSLVCNELILQNVEPGIQCTADVPYIFSKATDGGYGNSTYNLNDDSSITVTYTEDTQASCGGPFQSSFTLTKI